MIQQGEEHNKLISNGGITERVDSFGWIRIMGISWILTLLSNDDHHCPHNNMSSRHDWPFMPPPRNRDDEPLCTKESTCCHQKTTWWNYSQTKDEMSCTRRHADGGTTNATRATCLGIDRIVSSPKRVAIRQLRHAFATSHCIGRETTTLFVDTTSGDSTTTTLACEYWKWQPEWTFGTTTRLRDDIATFARQNDEHTAWEMALLKKWIQQVCKEPCIDYY
jgi:hypothetical protein